MVLNRFGRPALAVHQGVRRSPKIPSRAARAAPRSASAGTSPSRRSASRRRSDVPPLLHETLALARETGLLGVQNRALLRERSTAATVGRARLASELGDALDARARGLQTCRSRKAESKAFAPGTVFSRARRAASECLFEPLPARRQASNSRGSGDRHEAPRVAGPIVETSANGLLDRERLCWCRADRAVRERNRPRRSRRSATIDSSTSRSREDNCRQYSAHCASCSATRASSRRASSRSRSARVRNARTRRPGDRPPRRARRGARTARLADADPEAPSRLRSSACSATSSLPRARSRVRELPLPASSLLLEVFGRARRRLAYGVARVFHVGDRT